MAELTAYDVDRSERLRAITDNFFFWQGLRFVALGPVLMLAGLVASLREIHEPAGDVILVAAAIAAILASSRLGQRYRHEFGVVNPIPGAHRTRSLAKWLVVYPLMFGALALDFWLPMPVMVSGLVWGGAVLLYRQSTGGGREHYLVLAAVLAALALGPLAVAVTSRQMIFVMFVVLGAGFSVCAVLDDREMRRVLKGS